MFSHTPRGGSHPWRSLRQSGSRAVERAPRTAGGRDDFATWLLHQSVPFGAKISVNPAADPSNVAAGKDLFKEKCETCHGYDGGGKTVIGSHEFPRVPTLRSPAIAATSDGELFYHIRNGIRNTGMPAWNLPDREIWQLVSFIRHLPEWRR